MNYSALIENRRSVREFTDQKVCPCKLTALKEYYHQDFKRLVPEVNTALLVFGKEVREKLEGAAGYESFLIGAPNYLVLLTEEHPQAILNAGYIMQDLSLKLSDMDLGSCWITFTDSEAVKKALSIDSKLQVAAILAFGHGKKAPLRPRINIFSMSNVDIKAKRRYMDPKKSVGDLLYLNVWGNRYGLESYLGFFGDMLWEALHAVSLAPSYLNRQAYAFILREGEIYLVSQPDLYNNDLDGGLSLGAALLHFDAVAAEWAGNVHWNFSPAEADLGLPAGYRVVASSKI